MELRSCASGGKTAKAAPARQGKATTAKPTTATATDATNHHTTVANPSKASENSVTTNKYAALSVHDGESPISDMTALTDDEDTIVNSSQQSDSISTSRATGTAKQSTNETRRDSHTPKQHNPPEQPMPEGAGFDEPETRTTPAIPLATTTALPPVDPVRRHRKKRAERKKGDDDKENRAPERVLHQDSISPDEVVTRSDEPGRPILVPPARAAALAHAREPTPGPAAPPPMASLTPPHSPPTAPRTSRLVNFLPPLIIPPYSPPPTSPPPRHRHVATPYPDLQQLPETCEGLGGHSPDATPVLFRAPQALPHSGRTDTAKSEVGLKSKKRDWRERSPKHAPPTDIANLTTKRPRIHVDNLARTAAAAHAPPTRREEGPSAATDQRYRQDQRALHLLAEVAAQAERIVALQEPQQVAGPASPSGVPSPSAHHDPHATTHPLVDLRTADGPTLADFVASAAATAGPTQEAALVITPMPQLGFPEHHGRARGWQLANQSRESIAGWIGIEGGKVLAVPFGQGANNHKIADRLFAVVAHVQQVLARYLGISTVHVTPPIAAKAVTDVNQAPFAFLIHGISAGRAAQLLAQRCISTPNVTVMIYPFALILPALFVSFGHIVDCGREMVRNMAIATMLREHNLHAIVELLRETPGMLPTMDFHVLARRLIDTARITRSERYGKGGSLTPVYNLFLSTSLMTVDTWRQWHQLLNSFQWGDVFLAEVSVRHDIECDGCHGRDHYQHACPFMQVPGWHGIMPTPRRRTAAQPPWQGPAGTGDGPAQGTGGPKNTRGPRPPGRNHPQ